MAANVVNRETVRDAFAALLSAALVGDGLPVKAVYNYRIGDFQGQSPVVVVSSSGSGRGAASFTSSASAVYLDVFIFVLYSDEGSWGEDDAEDRLDLIEKEIADVMEDNTSSAYWMNMDYEGRSTVTDIAVGGKAYKRELIPLRFDAVNPK